MIPVRRFPTLPADRIAARESRRALGYGPRYGIGDTMIPTRRYQPSEEILMSEEMPDFSNVQSGSSSTAPKIYEVVSGDSLSKIAKREYGNANEWRRIYEANQDVLKDPDKIYPGQKLKIPPL
jgi:nucleoid-associated protein YgaU